MESRKNSTPAKLKRLQGQRIDERLETDPLAYLDSQIIKRFSEEMDVSDADFIGQLRIELGLKGLLHALSEVPPDKGGIVELIKGLTRIEIDEFLVNPDVFTNFSSYPEIVDSPIEWNKSLTDRTADKTMNLIRFGAVSAGRQTGFEALRASFEYYREILDSLKLPYRSHLDGPYPYMEILPKGETDTMFLAHLDIAEAQDKKQFKPRVSKDKYGQKWLEGRGSADMIGSTMVATVALSEAHKRFKNIPGMLIVFNEEQAEQEYKGHKTGTNAFIDYAAGNNIDLSDKTFIALERTNNPAGSGVYKEADLVGEIADKSRGAMSINIRVKGVAGHGGAVRSVNLSLELPRLQEYLVRELCKNFPLTTKPGFNNQIIPIAIKCGQPDSTTLPGEGELEIMMRVVPGADLDLLKRLTEKAINNYGLDSEYYWKCIEPGPVASRDNKVLKRMAASISQCYGDEAVKFQNKPHASSARILVAANGCEAFVWGPTAGLMPHGRHERLHLDSISAGGKVLVEFLERSNKCK